MFYNKSMCKITKTDKNIFYFKNKYINDKDLYYVVNPVNTAGVMGKGLAKKFKENSYSHFNAYKKALENNELRIGKVFVDEKNKIIAFPTKKHWRGKSKIEYIENGLLDLKKEAEQRKIKYIILPKLGSGLGGLDYKKDVLPLIRKTFNDSTVEKVIISVWPMKK